MPPRRRAPVNVVVFQCPCGTAALAAQGTTTDPGHLGQGTVLIDEDQVVRIEVRLSVEPGAAPLGDVDPLLLGCVRCFFEGHAVAVEEAPHGAGREGCLMFGAQHLSQLDQADVLLGLHRAQDYVPECLDTMRPRIAALRLGLDRTGRVHSLHPTHGAGRRNTKTLSRSPAGQAARYGRHQSGTKVHRK